MSEKEIVRSQRKRLVVIRHALEVSHNVAKTCRYYGIARSVFTIGIKDITRKVRGAYVINQEVPSTAHGLPKQKQLPR